MANTSQGFNLSNLKLVSHVLGNFSKNAVFDTEFVHQDYCPIIPVDALSGIFRVSKEGDYFELARKYAGGVWADSAGEEWSSSTYTCSYWAEGYKAVKDDMAEADANLNLLQNRISKAIRKVERRKEFEFFNLVGTTASYGTKTALTTSQCWVTTAGIVNQTATIKEDVNLQKLIVASAGNFTFAVNTMFIPVNISMGIYMHADIYDIQKYTNPDLIYDSGMPMKLWGLRIIEVKGQYVSIAQGKKASPTKSKFLSDKVGFAHINMNDAEQTWIARFQRFGRRHMIEKNDAKVISGEISECFQTKVIHTAMASLIDNVHR